ncbi:MAG: hypothetical protein M0P01_01585 [Treponema sp.]|nr:hypothetical protein [Treponema sp.]
MVIYKQLRIIASVVFIGSVFYTISAEGVKASSAESKSTSSGTVSEMPAMPSISSISSPAMPAISAPTIGSSFYTPGEISSTKSSAGTTSSKQTPPEAKTTSQSLSAATDINTSSLTPLGQNSLSSSVTASDLSLLDNAGLLSSFYSSLNTRPTTNAASTGTLLTNILQQLDELKKENKSVISDPQTNKNTGVTNNTAARNDSTTPGILRFRVNGYDILATCRTIYFSDRESNGSFLLTGDRKYVSNGNTHDETFYLLFKATGSAGVSTQYIVKPAVVQDYVNKYSFIYQLAQKNNLSATKTGNLITMRLNEPSYNMDLLIDIGNKKTVNE